MVARTGKRNVNHAHKIGEKASKNFKKALVFAGKPFYYLLSSLVILFAFVFFWTGEAFKKLIKYVFGFFTISLPSQTKRLLKGLKLPKISLELKRPKFPIPKPPFKIPRPSLRTTIWALLVISPFIALWFFVLRGLPSPKELVTRDIEVSTKIYDRNGILLYKIYKEKNRTLVPLKDIPENVRLATLAAEDAEFYAHPGFSIKGMIRAIYRNLTRSELSGGSTITQQLVKNALLSSEKTIIRKLREIILAIEVEIAFSKDEILEMYLNEVSYGGTAYGVQEAARVYFDKDVQDLTLAEAALLAGLPKSPTRFSPFGPTPEQGMSRQKDIIHLMRINKFITEEQEEEALQEKLVFAQNRIDIKAPHFVMYVKKQLSEKYGEEVVEKGGLEVVTTLDYSIQKLTEEVVGQEVSKLKNLRVGNGASVVLNPKTGEILAMVGSKDYFDTANDGNVNVVTSPRQPGSSIKVINYAYALSNGYTPATIVSDSPVTFSVPGQEPYSPKNYDGSFRGKLSLRSAFAESRNVPAVKVLATYGVQKMIDLGQKMGITTWENRDRFGLSLTLGGGEVKLIDLARVYATVANYGKRPQLTSIIGIKNHKGKTLEKQECIDPDNPPKIPELVAKLIKRAKAAEAKIAAEPCNQPQVIDKGVAFLLTDILKDNQARAPAFGRYSELVIPGHPEVAVKTGTSNDLRDNLTIGYNQDYLVAVWVGNNDNSPMSRVASGVTGASPIFNTIMSRLLVGTESKAWAPPEDVVKLGICSITGTLPCKGCPTRSEWFLKENTPKAACNPEDIIARTEEEEKKEQILPEAAQTEGRRRFILGF